MDPGAADLSKLAVHLTGRLSTILFSVVLIAPAVSRRVSQRSTRLFLTFVIAQTVHFAAVLWFASVTGGAHLFPGDRSLQEVGGWPTMLGIFTLFYVPAFVGLAARRAGSAAGRWLRVSDRIATMAIGFMFVATYVPLVARSPWFLVPTAVVLVALVAYSVRSKAHTNG